MPTTPRKKTAPQANQSVYFNPHPLNNKRVANLCGPLNAHLEQIANSLDVVIHWQRQRFQISGVRVKEAQNILEELYQQSEKPLALEDIQLFLVEKKSLAERTIKNGDEIVLKTRRTDLHGRTQHQKQYLQMIQAHDIGFGVGPAGTGKTYLAVACAVDALERDSVKRIVLTRPAVEAGERLGFLPGDLAQKIDPYLRPLYDALYDLLGAERTQKYIEKQIIEIAPLAYMRGRTLNHAFVILDEAQNTTSEQMKMFLTRIGFGSKAVVTGDVTQIDLQRGIQSGLVQALHVLQNVKGIGFTHFDSSDVVRHPLVARIIDAYSSAVANAK